MGAGTVTAILALLQAFPSVFAAAAEIRATASLTDQEAIDAALDAAKLAAQGHISQAITDLNSAAQS